MKQQSDLRIYTSFVSPVTLKNFTEKNLLPVFIIRSIINSTLIGAYSDSPIHFKELSPSTDLFRSRRDNKITQDEYQKKYALEITVLDLKEEVRKLELLKQLSGASGIVLLGYGSSYDQCHRKVLSEILNNSGLLENRVEEILI